MASNVSRDAPVGVFDSGVGGLSVLGEIRTLLPNESLLYIADSGHVPYGEKSPEFIRERCRVLATFLLTQGAKALVLACNTATVAGVAELRELYPQLPIIGMEPAVKPAAAATKVGVVGVLATTGTLKSAKFAALLDRFASDVRVITQPCPGLVERIEAGDLSSEQTRTLLQGFVAPLLEQGCDTLILGCTHYPFIKPLLQTLVPPSVSLIDTGAAVARQLQRLLDEQRLLARGPARPAQFWSSGNVTQLENLLTLLWGERSLIQSFDNIESDCWYKSGF
ncbi:glutamate racemase [Pseudomonas sp. EA_35y_Pfl2_R111]|uniref:glutamate racemase n=1 Tax=Pseudomonas sp. EA_35y_Pfl2_R111 TaxID=3088689 RepID=UPI0030D92ED2